MKQTKFRWKPSAALLLSLVCLLTVVGGTPVRAAEDTATREYAIAAFIEAIGMETLEGSPDALAAFTDADQIGEQYAEAMAKAVAGGIVIGNGDGTLRPKDMIRRIEALVLLSRCLPELPAAGEALAFTDVPAWAQEEVNRLSAAGIVKGYGDGTLGAEEYLTAEQVSLLTARVRSDGNIGALETANTLEQIFTRHKSVSVDKKLYFNGEEAYDMDWYLTADSYYETYNNGFASYRSADLFLETFGDDDSEIAMLLTDDAGYQEWYQELFVEFKGLVWFPDTEKLVSVQEENGNLLVTTRQEDAEFLTAYIENNYATLGVSEQYVPGMSLTFVYRFDAESHDLKELRSTLRKPDGSETPFEANTYSYDVEGPDLAAPGAPLAAYFDKTRDMRTVTVVFAYGAPEEHAERFTFPIGIWFGIWYDGMIPENIYEDPECTQVFEDTNGRTELTLYIPPSLEG